LGASPEANRRRSWILAWSVPPYLALAFYGTIAVFHGAHGPALPEAVEALVARAFMVGALVAGWSCACGPVCCVVALVLLSKDRWRKDRSSLERFMLTVLVLGSWLAWVASFVAFARIVNT
jgi:hypothetical protein